MRQKDGGRCPSYTTTTDAMFNLDEKQLDDPEFKEDAIREEIIAPILHRLGYEASGPNRIVRSRALIHPFVRIGSKKHKISIIPDYVLEVDGRPCAILDAKRPTETLLHTHHAEQAYSYAIHPEIRCRYYALCNGRQLVVYDRERFHPAIVVDFCDIDRRWDQIESILSPRNTSRLARLNLHPDFGLSLKKAGLDQVEYHFLGALIPHLAMAKPDLLVSSPATTFEEVIYAISFDFYRPIFGELFRFVSERDMREIPIRLNEPGDYYELIDPFQVHLTCRMGELQHGEHEDYIPFVTIKIADSPLARGSS
jgi:hypothetical protein